MFADNLQTEPAGGQVPAQSKTTQRMLREISPAEQQHYKKLSMKDKAAFRSKCKKVMGNFVERTEERKEWQTVGYVRLAEPHVRHPRRHRSRHGRDKEHAGEMRVDGAPVDEVGSHGRALPLFGHGEGVQGSPHALLVDLHQKFCERPDHQDKLGT